MKKKFTKNCWKRIGIRMGFLLCFNMLCCWFITNAKGSALPHNPVTISADVTVKGTVSDKEGRLPGVTVTLKSNNQIGTVSNSKGAFNITVPENGILVFKFIGY